MKKHFLSCIILFAALVLILAFSAGCSCANEPINLLPEGVLDTDTASDTDSSETSTSESTSQSTTVGTSATDMTTSATDTTTTSATDTVTTEATTTSSTAKTSSTSSKDDSLNAPGVYKPNYKTKYYIVVHTGSQSVAIYGKDDNGYYNDLVKCFTCSTGTKGHETRTGAYTIWRKFRWRALVGGVYGQYNSSISRDYLFHSVPYLKQSVDRLDDEEYDKLGTPASHGCIRLCVRDAKWIYDNCAIDTQVYITNTSGPAGASVPTRNTDPAYSGWDPSDKWAKYNPYFYSPSTASKTTTTAATEGTAQTTTTASAEVSATTTAGTTTTATATTTESTTITTTTATTITTATAAEETSGTE